MLPILHNVEFIDQLNSSNEMDKEKDNIYIESFICIECSMLSMNFFR